MYSVVTSGAVYGLDAYMVKVEADAGRGLPGFEMVGMPSGEVKEAKERVKVALKNLGITFPPVHITVNFSPANVRKSGTCFDLPIAIALMIANGEIDQESTKDILLMGELGLNGEIQFAKGVLPIVIKAKESGIKKCLVPAQNVREGAVVEGIDVIGISSLSDVISYLKMNETERESVYPKTVIDTEEIFESQILSHGLDFGDVVGQEGLKRAAVIATAGFHHMLMVGPPGAGKTMIAKRIPTILPKLSMEESLEVTKIYSISGLLKEEESLKITRPFSSPHHTISEQALAGGGTIPKPGAISLAHRGVLFMDEAVHFSASAIETLRQPLEDKKIVISRSAGTFTYPADFMLVAAINLVIWCLIQGYSINGLKYGLLAA